MERIFMEILNNALTASWIILAVMLYRVVFKRTPKWIICLLWGLAALKLVLPLNIESVLSLIPSARPIQYSASPQIDTGVQTIDSAVNLIISSNLAANTADSVNPIQVWTGILSIVWVLGVAAMILYAIVSFFILNRKVSASIKQNKNIYECDEINTPFILGIIRPRIYLPSGMDSCVMDCVIEHEKTHIKRGDYFWKPLGFLILSLYWFNPLCWAAYVLLCKDIELACDEKTTRDKDKEWKAEYCQALLDCNKGRKMITVCPVAFGEVGVKERVKSVLTYKKPALWFVVISIAACIVVAVCFLTNPKSVLSIIEDYKAISYKEYQELTGYDAEFYHGLYYIGRLPETEISIVFEAEWDDDLAGAVLSEDSKAIRLQGKLSDFLGKHTQQLSESELLHQISEDFGKVISIDYMEGAGTAYYVGGYYYARILVESSSDDNMNTVIEIAVENQTEGEKMFWGDSYFWFIWEEIE